MANADRWPLPDPNAVPASVPFAARLLLDSWDQFNRAVDALPTPGQAGAFGRLNAGGWIVAHVARQQDRYWNLSAQRRKPDAWLAEQVVGSGEESSNPPWEEACAAWARVQEGALPYLLGLTADEVQRQAPKLPDRLGRAVAHLFVHAGELSAVASLAGAPDLGLPGELRYSTGSDGR